MRPHNSILAITLTCCLLSGGATVLSGQSNTAVADAGVSIGFLNSGGQWSPRGSVYRSRAAASP